MCCPGCLWPMYTTQLWRVRWSYWCGRRVLQLWLCAIWAPKWVTGKLHYCVEITSNKMRKFGKCSLIQTIKWTKLFQLQLGGKAALQPSKSLIIIAAALPVSCPIFRRFANELHLLLLNAHLPLTPSHRLHYVRFLLRLDKGRKEIKKRRKKNYRLTFLFWKTLLLFYTVEIIIYIIISKLR